MGSVANSIARKGQGRNSLAGSRDSVPCGVWGNAPTAGRETNTKKAANKGAGSKASLPVTLRVRRRAPKQVLPTTILCRAKWVRPHRLPAASAHNPPKNLGTTAQLGGASADVFSAICGMQISRFTASKPSKFAFASDEKSIRQPTTSFVRCYLILFPAFACAICLRREFGNSIKKAGARRFKLHAPALRISIIVISCFPRTAP